MKSSARNIQIAPIIFDTILMLLFILGVQLPIVGIITGVLGYILCLFYILNKDLCRSFRFYTIFLTASIEVSYFATGVRDGQTVYSFIVLPYVTIYMLFGINFLMFLIIACCNWNANVKNCQNKGLIFLYKASNYMMIVGLLMWLITYLLNDNNIFGQSWYHTMTVAEVYRMSILYFTVHNAIVLLVTNKDFCKQLEVTLTNLLFSLVPAGLLATLIGFNGYRAGQSNMLMLPLYAFFAFSLFAFPQYKQFRDKKIVFYICAIAMFGLMIIRPTPLGGKWFLSIVFVLALIIYTSSPIYGLTMLSLGMVTFVFLTQTEAISYIFGADSYLLLKYNEASELFSTLFGKNENVISGSSSSFRLDELINIMYEYASKPGYIIFGKGIVGSTLHHTNSLSWDGAGSFSAVQREAGVYIRVHESINLIFLKYGIVGLFGMAKIIGYGIKSVKKAPWAVIGILWLLFYVGVYQTLLFGAIALVLGLYQANLDNEYELCSRKNERE